MDETIVVVVRSLIAFFTLLIFTRILGKQQVGQLTAFEYILGITVGSIAASLSIDLSIKPFPIWISIGIWVLLAYVLQIISIKNRLVAKIIDDQPTIVIQNGKILEENLKKTRYRYDELMSQLRDKDIFDITQVEFALIEANGKITVLKKAEYQPVTPKDMGITVSPLKLMIEIIQDGKWLEQNIIEQFLDKEKIKLELQAQGVNEIKEINYAAILPNGQIYVDKFRDNLKDEKIDIGDYKGIY